MSSSSKKVQEIGGNVAFSQANDGDSVTNDLNAAKIAAMKAAELGMKCQYIVTIFI